MFLLHDCMINVMDVQHPHPLRVCDFYKRGATVGQKVEVHNTHIEAHRRSDRDGGWHAELQICVAAAGKVVQH